MLASACRHKKRPLKSQPSPRKQLFFELSFSLLEFLGPTFSHRARPPGQLPACSAASGESKRDAFSAAALFSYAWNPSVAQILFRVQSLYLPARRKPQPWMLPLPLGEHNLELAKRKAPAEQTVSGAL